MDPGPIDSGFFIFSHSKGFQMAKSGLMGWVIFAAVVTGIIYAVFHVDAIQKFVTGTTTTATTVNKA
jgi:hypothetical protein